MLNDITQYYLRHELWSIESTGTLFYKEYINEGDPRMVDFEGKTIEITEEDMAAAILIDGSLDLLPEWLR